MISREEALDHIFMAKNIKHVELKQEISSCEADLLFLSRKDILNYVSSVFDSIGSCSTCYWYISLKSSSPTDLTPLCELSQENKQPTYYCADYMEKK